jgi:hypothetical protein
MKKALVILGVCLLIAGVATFAVENFKGYPPLLGSVSEQADSVNYLTFFGFAFGGAGVLILAFVVLQWFWMRRSKQR